MPTNIKMTDIKTQEERSLNMAKIRSKNTKPEVWLRGQLFRRGYRYRKNAGSITGHPDIWLRKYDTAVFVNGCFWHRNSGCKYAYMPKSRVEFWADKFSQNMERDGRVKEELEKQGIRILIVWECTIKKMCRSIENETEIMGMIECFLNSDKRYLEL